MFVQPRNKILPLLMVAGGATLWGIIGVFIHELDRAGFSALQIVALRVVAATILLFLYIRFRYPEKLRIKLIHLHYFIGTGILSISFFNWSYFTAINETSLSVAVILLYTGPAFVVIMARILFGERLTIQKTVALLLTFSGAALVVEFIPFTATRISWYGIAVGTGAGFGYALYTIFSKIALREYSPLTIIFYTFLTASVFLMPFSGALHPQFLGTLTEPYILWLVAGLGFFPTALAYLLYTEGLSQIEAGKASITSMLEPVAATMIGITFYGEILQVYQILGVLMVLISVVMIQFRAGKKHKQYSSTRTR